MSTFPIRTPTDAELEACATWNLTSQEKWELHSELLVSKEERAVRRISLGVSNATSSAEAQPRGLYAIESNAEALRHMSAVFCELNSTYDDACLLQDLCESVRVCSSTFATRHINTMATYEPDNKEIIAAVKTREQMPLLDPILLAKRWHIGLETAKSTLHITTQRGLRSAIDPLAIPNKHATAAV
jgi:hypothetical protein